MADLSTKEEEYKAFLNFHGPQLNAMGLPENLQRKLFTKLKFQDFDAGQNVQMLLDEENMKMYLRSQKDLKANDDVFLIDHAFTFKQRSLYKTLKENEKLLERLENMLKMQDKIDLPMANPYEPKRPSFADYMKK